MTETNPNREPLTISKIVHTETNVVYEGIEKYHTHLKYEHM